MPSLVRINLDQVVALVQTVLKNFPQVAGAYLFGSSLGLCRPDSDIDLGLILEPEIKPDSKEGDKLEADIALYLPPVDGHPFDIVLLDPDKPLFTFHVLKKGKLIYCRNMERVTDVVEYVSRRYADLYPRYIRALDEVISEVMEMALDRQRIISKISYIREQVTGINELLERKTKEEILEDPWLIRGLKYSLQTAIEAMIDLAYHISAKKYGHAPTDPRDAMRVLLEQGVISRSNWRTYSSMIGFRNRVVLGYEEVSPERVYEMARNELGDFEKFIQEIKAVLSSERSN